MRLATDTTEYTQAQLLKQAKALTKGLGVFVDWRIRLASRATGGNVQLVARYIPKGRGAVDEVTLAL